ncbi:MAG: restriction endonuclease subunit S [Bacteroidota bacterium]|nr:restriction endonuclease subunit S [Bacteroidota bacterium]
MNKISWETCKVGEIIKLEYGKPLPKSVRNKDCKYPVYGANGIKTRSNKYYFDKPSIIVGRKGSAGELNLTEGKFWPLDVCYYVTFNDEKFNLKFIYNLLSVLELPKLAKGVKPGINRNEVYSINVKIPPLPEQKRIVKILDDVFEKIEKAKENAKKNLQNARELFESYLQSVFENRNGDWEETVLGDEKLLEIIDGDRGKNYPKKSDFLNEGHCLFMNTKNVRPDGFDFTTTMFINEKKDKAMGKGKLKRNDVVLTTRGTIGNIGQYSEEIKFDNLRINSGMLIFRPNIKFITSEYLFEMLRSGFIKTQIRKHVSGAAQPQLPIKTLVNFLIAFPKNINEQNKLVKKLNALSSQTKKLESIYKQKISDLDELKKSILKKAFSGEL